ncbi:MAG: MotA/TolQ/ExbB proton channel family protein [Opitutales bacterium]
MGTFEEIFNVWVAGGPVMIALVILSVLLYSTAFQLMLYVLNTNLTRNGEERWSEWVADPANAPGRVGQILRYVSDRVQSSKHIRDRFDEVRISMTGMLERRITYLSTLVAVAPLMGLLGTVIGMLQTFLGIATQSGFDTAGVVAGGISEALITTLTGLTIALPGLFIAMIVRRQMHHIEATIARLESLTLTHHKFE